MRNNKRALLVIGFGLCLLFLFTWNVKGDGTGDYLAPENGDWTINNETNVWNETIILNGNLTIYGNLTFKNVTLIMNCSQDGEYGIIVNESAKLQLFDYDNNPETINDTSNITANNTEYEFEFLVNSNSKFIMKNSELSECGYWSGEDGTAGLTIKTNNTIIENSSFYNNYYGIYFYSSNNNTIINNSIYSNNYYGIFIHKSVDIKMRANIIINSKYNFGIESNDILEYYHDIDSSNIINGKPIIYFIEKHNFIIDDKTNGSYFGLISCNNVTIKNLNLSNNIQGILLANTTNCQIKDNEFSDNRYGIYFYSSSNNKIITNTISNNLYGIYLYNSSNNKQIINNNVTNNNYGIYLTSSSNSNQIDYNTLSDNTGGICIEFSINNTIMNNSVFSNNQYGIYLFSSNNNQITNNNIYDNYYGISFYSSNNNLHITNNNILNNNYGFRLESTSNVQIKNNNNFFNNNYGIYLESSSDIKIINSTISDSSQYDIYLKSQSYFTSINSTFNKNKISIGDMSSELTVNWYLHVNMHDSGNNPIPDVGIIVENLKGNEIYNRTTRLDGWIRWILCTEYVKKKGGTTYYTEHTIRTEKDDIQVKVTVTMDENKFIYLKPNWYNITLECEYSKKSIKPDNTINYNIKITNTGTKNNKISFEVINPTNWLAYLNSYNTFLLPEESKTINLTVKPPEDELAGNISTVYVKGISEFEQNIQAIIETETTVDVIHLIEILQNQLYGNINPGESIKYEIELMNFGNGEEKINLKKNDSQSGSQKDWEIEIETDFQSLIIGVGKYHTTSVIITPPFNALANEQLMLVFDVLSNDFFLGSFTIFTTVNQTHAIEIKCDQKEMNAKPSETVTFELKLTNNGNGYETFYLELIGENNDWGKLNDSYISIESNQTKNVTLYVKVPNDAKFVDKANITINVLSLDHSQKYTSLNILTNVIQIFDLNLEIEEKLRYKEILIEPGNDFKFNATIQNFGNGIDEINLSINDSKSRIPKDWKIEPKTIITSIDFKSSIIKSIKVTSTKNTLASEKAILVFDVKSNKYGDSIFDFIELEFYVNQIYEIELKCTNPNKDVIPGKSIDYKIEFKNKGNGKDTVKIGLSGRNSNWGYLNESILILDVNESKSITLTVNAAKTALTGEKASINIHVILENGKTSKPLTITTTVNIIENKEPKADFKITYKNNEITKVKIGEVVTFDASGSLDEDGKIEIYQWDFGNGEIRYGNKVNYTYPKDTKPGKYTITLKVTDNNGVTKEKQMTIEVFEEKEEEKNSVLYLILVLILIFGILIIIMLYKIVKTMKGETEKTTIFEKGAEISVPFFEKEPEVSVPSFEEEEIKKDEQKIMEPEKKEEKPEQMFFTKEETIQFEDMKEELKESPDDSKENVKWKIGEELKKEKDEKILKESIEEGMIEE